MMKFGTYCALALLLVVAGCAVEEFVRKNDDRYLVPGAMDSPLTGVYNSYRFDLLDRYRITHEWLQSGCRYRGVELPVEHGGRRGLRYVGRDIVEKDGKTWLRFSEGKLFDFDPWVRSVPYVSRAKGREGTLIEIGHKPVCFENWWATRHFVRLRLNKGSVADFEASFARDQPEGAWHNEHLNGLQWRVQQVPPERLRPREETGPGGPYQTWITALGDTGYALSIEMGADAESLNQPRAHAAIGAVFQHLLRSIKVERLAP